MSTTRIDITLINKNINRVQGATVAEHLEGLEQVFKAYRRARLRLNPLKCHLFRDTVTYLGYKVTADGLSPTDEYVEVVKTWPMPRTRNDNNEENDYSKPPA